MRDLESLIEDIYVAALKPDRWPAVLRAIAAETGSRDCVFQSLRVAPDGVSLAEYQAGDIDQPAMEAYANTIAAIGDPRVEHALRQPLGHVNQDHEFISKAEMRRHPYYEDWLRPLGFRYAAIVVASLEQSREHCIAAGIGLQRSARQGPLEGHALRRFEALAPHVVRSARVASRMLPSLPSQAADGQARDACFGLNDRGMVLEMNEIARSWIAGAQVRIGADGCLWFRERSLRHAVDLALRAALVRDSRVPLGGRVRLASQVVSYVVVVLPADPAIRDLASVSGVALELRVRVVVAGIASSQLTPAQERIVARLAQGHRLRDLAGELGISYETARFHVKQAMLKWDVRSQTGLVAKWLHQREFP